MGSRRGGSGWTGLRVGAMLGAMFGIHPAYLVVLLAIVLIIFGPGKLPELGGAVGRAMREFQHSVNGISRPPAATEERPAEQDEPVEPVRPPEPLA